MAKILGSASRRIEGEEAGNRRTGVAQSAVFIAELSPTGEQRAIHHADRIAGQSGGVFKELTARAAGVTGRVTQRAARSSRPFKGGEQPARKQIGEGAGIGFGQHEAQAGVGGGKLLQVTRAEALHGCGGRQTGRQPVAHDRILKGLLERCGGRAFAH